MRTPKAPLYGITLASLAFWGTTGSATFLAIALTVAAVIVVDSTTKR